MKILIAEDDPITREGLAEIFATEGYRVLTAENGLKAIEIFTREAPEVVCLDIMMPEKDGFEVCRHIRTVDPHVAILFLSAKGEEIDKVVGLELGADDFIVKPFGVREVIARIRAITRRCLALHRGQLGTTTATNSATHSGTGAPAGDPLFRMKDLEVFPLELRAKRGQTVIDLSLRETRLLQLFHQHPGKPLDRYLISVECWGEEHIPTSRTLDQHVSLLRKKIESDPKNPVLITTVHGVGYRFDP
jgi:DNA-binding response OmpR family regulator